MRSFLYIVVLLVGLAGVLAVLPLAPFQTVGVSAQAAPAANTGMSQNIQQQAMGAANQTNPTFGCGSSFSIEGCGTMAAYYIMKGCAWIAVWASVILNYVIMELVVGMGVLVGNMPGVAHAWEMLRDLTNVFLVFITVYIGISIIVGASNFGSKQMLGRIILAALLVNFSITVAKLVIDVSNVTAITAYDMILKQNADDFKTTVVRPGECAQVSEKAYDPAENTCITTGLAGVFWSRLQMTKIFNVADFQAQDGKKADDALIWVGLLGAIMFIIMAFIFGAMAFMLIGRFLILVMLIIFSPLAFVSLITGISGKGRVWWTMLINQSIVAPVMFIMLWITYGLLDGFSNRFELKGGIAKSAMADMGAMGIVTYFMIICGSLIMSLIVAKELGAYGASAAMSTGKNWSKKIGMAPVNKTRDWARTGGQALRDRTLSRWADNRMKRREKIYADANELNADGTPRRRGVMHSVRRKLTGTAWDRAKRARQETKGAGARTLDQARQARGQQVAVEVNRQQDLEAARLTNRHHNQDDATIRGWATANPTLTPDVHDPAGGASRKMNADEFLAHINDARRRVGKISQHTQEWLVQNHADVISSPGTATRMGASQMQSLEQSTNVTNAQTAPIQRARRTTYEGTMGFTPGTAANPAAAREVSRNLSESEWRTIAREVVGPRLQAATTLAQVDAIFDTMPESAVQYLPANVFRNGVVQERLTPGHLTILTNANTIQDPADRRLISRHILSGPGLAATREWLTRSSARFVWL